ncbi:MAG: four helix bundle protein [Candidatus Omnitrophica bacterium]|nr:four helix bundle protein [Candidatus Omnitrophota bacterium]MBU1048198.1 four helix bundle protein [Candidatus Omnitrophota bacterium]MBU1631392.1 four helix bundle protein [Candidatus Omnitrophota bacterium]MBU1766927.1 four helix bundle protein [Candidatus Omnitrophota bacterium]MBU1888708.1 four helix bundle protein [Candidatus Omnitrophota bacterium]
MKSYKDLEVWKKGIELVKKVYLITKKFPKEEVYGLTNQMRRAAVSIPSNIAEGKMRQHTNEYVQFLYIALGSCGELDTQLIISEQLGYISKQDALSFADESDHISRMIRNLIKTIRK